MLSNLIKSAILNATCDFGAHILVSNRPRFMQNLDFGSRRISFISSKSAVFYVEVRSRSSSLAFKSAAFGAKVRSRSSSLAFKAAVFDETLRFQNSSLAFNSAFFVRRLKSMSRRNERSDEALRAGSMAGPALGLKEPPLCIDIPLFYSFVTTPTMSSTG